MSDDIAEAVEALKNAVGVLKANPELLHTPELTFFKDYLQSLGAKIPSPHAKDNKSQTEEKKPVS